jgi:DNA-binding Lrp family transcriptional regulator
MCSKTASRNEMKEILTQQGVNLSQRLRQRIAKTICFPPKLKTNCLHKHLWRIACQSNWTGSTGLSSRQFEKIGIGLSVYSRIALVAQDAATVESFAQAMNALPQVVECHIMAGECDALLRVVASDLNAYRRFQIAHLTRENGVQSVKTDVPIQTVKSSTELPI